VELTPTLRKHLQSPPGEEPAVTILGDLGYDYIYTCPPLEGGREVIIRRYQRTLAGAAGYFSTGLARLGAVVHLLTEVGDDPAGGSLRKEARSLGVRPEGIRTRRGCGSPFSLIFAGESEQSPRQVATFLGTLEDLSARALDYPAALASSHLAYSCNYFLLPRLREEIGEVFAQARRLGRLTAYDANAGDGWDSPAALRTLVERIYPHTDVIFLNEAEAAALSGGKPPERALALVSPASETVVIKLGPCGALLRHRDTVTRCPAFPLLGPVRDTVGAGDSFQAAFLYFLLCGLPAEQCLVLGAANGASTVLHVGGIPGQLDRRGLSAFLTRYRVGTPGRGRIEIHRIDTAGR
jgi:sugar/nucleoside kinase (ribokinase family)